MEDLDLPFTEPVASTSRAVFTLPYKPRVQSPPPRTDLARKELYEHAWEVCHSQIDKALSSLHDASLDRIVSFVHSSPAASDPLSLYTALSGGTPPLKTGLILGASPGSSSLIYNSLIRQLSHPSRDTPPTSRPVLVSRLTSRECSNVKNALRGLIAGFVGSDADLDPVEDDDDEEAVYAQPRASALKSALMVPEDVGNLEAWYEYRFGKQGNSKAPTLVVLLEDLEAVDGRDLNQVTATLSRHAGTLPLVLLLGVATTSTALHNLIPQQTTNRLDISHFFVDPGIGAFNALVRGVFVESRVPLALGPRAYQDLYRSFRDVHHSIDATITYLQYLYLNHFLSSPLAPLVSLTLPDPPRRPSSSSSARPEFDRTRLATLVASVPSLARGPNDDDDEREAGDASNRRPLERVARAWDRIGDATRLRAEGFEALVTALEFWDKKRSVETCLNLLLGDGGKDVMGGGGAVESTTTTMPAIRGMDKLIDELCSLVLQASSTKLPAFLRTMTSRLTKYCATSAIPEDEAPSTSILDFVRTRAQRLDEVLSKPRPSGRSNLVNVHLASGRVGAVHHKLPGFGETGGKGSSAVSEVDREFSELAKDVSEGMRDRFRTALVPCSDLRGYEIFFCDDTTTSKRLNPSPLPTLVKTLTRLDPLSAQSSFPSTTAVVSAGGGDDDDPSSTEPIPLDLAVAYRIYKDSHGQGRLVNLGDWWSGFELGAGDEPVVVPAPPVKSAPRSSSSSPLSSSKQKKRTRTRDDDTGHDKGEDEVEVDDDDDEEEEGDDDDDVDDDDGPARRKQARFLRAVADLAHLGFVHPTTRKPEHVLKSVY